MNCLLQPSKLTCTVCCIGRTEINSRGNSWNVIEIHPSEGFYITTQPDSTFFPPFISGTFSVCCSFLNTYFPLTYFFSYHTKKTNYDWSCLFKAKQTSKITVSDVEIIMFCSILFVVDNPFLYGTCDDNPSIQI